MSPKNFIIPCVSTIIIGIVLVTLIGQAEKVYALALTTLSDTQSSLKVNTLSDHTIQFVTQSGIGAGEGFSITFPFGYSLDTFSVNNFDMATSTSATCSGFSDALLASGAASGLTWGVTQGTSSVYFTSGTATIPANRCIQVRIGSNAISQASGTMVITNPVASGQNVISISSDLGDSGIITEHIIDNDTVSMTGTISQALTFSISTTTLYFGTLNSVGAKFASSTNPSGDTIETVAHTLSVNTNAPSGFTISVRGQTLTSQQNSANTISVIGATAASSTPGTEQFGLRATESGGIGTAVSSPFNSATSYGYAATATTSEILATGSGSTPTSIYSLSYVVNIAAVTEAGIYAADLVYTATANF
jgi:hypothetical protein